MFIHVTPVDPEMRQIIRLDRILTITSPVLPGEGARVYVDGTMTIDGVVRGMPVKETFDEILAQLQSMGVAGNGDTVNRQ